MDYEITWTPCTANIGEVLNPFIDGIFDVTDIVYRQSVIYQSVYVNDVNDAINISGPNLTEIVQGAESQTGVDRFQGTLEIINCDALQSVSFPLLTACGYFSIVNCNALVSVDFSSFERVARNTAPNNYFTKLEITQCANIQTISFPALVEIDSAAQAFNISFNAALTTFSFPVFVPKNGYGLSFQNNALNQASVDHILARCVANPAYVSGTIRLNGGTNSTPSAAGLADKATLVGRGVTVLNN